MSVRYKDLEVGESPEILEQTEELIYEKEEKSPSPNKDEETTNQKEEPTQTPVKKDDQENLP